MILSHSARLNNEATFATIREIFRGIREMRFPYSVRAVPRCSREYCCVELKRVLVLEQSVSLIQKIPVVSFERLRNQCDHYFPPSARTGQLSGAKTYDNLLVEMTISPVAEKPCALAA